MCVCVKLPRLVGVEVSESDAFLMSFVSEIELPNQLVITAGRKEASKQAGKRERKQASKRRAKSRKQAIKVVSYMLRVV